MVLGTRGRKSQGAQFMAWLVLASMVIGQWQIVFAGSPPPQQVIPALIAQDSPARATGPVDRLRPVRFNSLDSSSAPSQLASLFDERAGIGLITDGPAKFRLQLRNSAVVQKLGVYDDAEGAIAIIPDGGTAVEQVIDLRKNGPRWNRFEVSNRAMSDSITFEWRPAYPGAMLREIELWGSVGEASPVAKETVRLPEALFKGLPSGAREFKGTGGALPISVASVFGSGEGGVYHVRLDEEPGRFDRVFLVYELAGLSHFTSAMRTINGKSPMGRSGATLGAPGGLQVEEISSRWLTRGENTIQFLPADESDPVGYRVSHLRIVGVPPSHNTLEDPATWRAVVDGSDDSVWEATRGKKLDLRDWTSAAVSQPEAVEFRLPKAGAGTLQILAGDKRTSAKATIDLTGFAPGWHRVSLATLPAGQKLRLSLTAGKEQSIAISELAISASPLPVDDAPRMHITYPLSGECVNHRVYVRGFIDPAGPANLFVNGTRKENAISEDGSLAFEVSDRESGGKAFQLNVEARYAGGVRVRRMVPIGGCVEQPALVRGDDGHMHQPMEDSGAPYVAVVHAKTATTLSFADATVDVPAGAVERDMRVSIRPLASDKIAAMDPGMTNVTPGVQAYRFGPHGMVFRKPVKLALPYDKGLIPQGYTESDVRTFYYDEGLKKWQQVGLLAQGKGALLALSEHFTDFINATITTPENPGTQSLNPTSMKDIKVANPAAGIGLIEPPTANSTGNAMLGMPIEVPPGRHGIQPSLAVNYDSSRCSTWMGQGWDLGLSKIEIDTRFGVPKYTGAEAYVLDGSQLTSIDGAMFKRRIEGRFDRIERKGTSATNYYWVVTDKSGTQFVYGQSANARLAALSDPMNIFAWHLEKVVDTLGNTMSVTYVHDNWTSDSVAITQIYPQDIDYTSHPTLSAPYRVHFELSNPAAQARSDVRLDARAGFVVGTRRLLQGVEVRYNSQRVRRYVFQYVTGDFGKMLLDSVAMSGAGTSPTLYTHNFHYEHTPMADSTSLRLFDDPQPWKGAVKADQTPETESAINRSVGKTQSGGVRVGYSFGFGPFGGNAGGGGTVVFGQDTTSWRSVDVNGDGLPDFIGAQGLVDYNSIGGSSTFTPNVCSDINYPLGSSARAIWGRNSGLNSPVSISEGNDISNRTAEQRLWIDINGDGFVDQVRHADNGIMVRLNDGHGGFVSEVAWPHYSMDGVTDCTLSGMYDFIKQAMNPFHGWIPVSDGTVIIVGTIILSGILGFAAPPPASDADGVRVDIYKGTNPTPIWTGQLAANQTTPCQPGPQSGCENTQPLTVNVQAGEPLYMKVNSLGTTTGDSVTWNPTIMYQNVPAAEVDLREPDGTYIHHSERVSDYRPVGPYVARWTAAWPGQVHIEAQLQKDTTPDDLSMRIVRKRSGQADLQILNQVHPASESAATLLDYGTLDVQAGDQLQFQVLSDVPIDPNRAVWGPHVVYTNLCRATDSSGNQVCGVPTCVPDQGVNHNTCHIPNDPLGNLPMDGDLVDAKLYPYYPLFKWAANGDTRTVVIPAAGSAAISGTLTKSATASRVVALIQGVNRLYWKQSFQPGESVSMPVNLQIDGLQANDQLFFSVVSDSNPAGAVTWTPKVNAQAAPVNVRYRDLLATPDPSGYGVVPVMNGGFHGWYSGNWNSKKDFDATKLMADPVVAAEFFHPSTTMVAPPASTSSTVGSRGVSTKLWGISWGNVVDVALPGVRDTYNTVVDTWNSGGSNIFNFPQTIAGDTLTALTFIEDLLRSPMCANLAGLQLAEASNFYKSASVGGGPIGVGVGFTEGETGSLVDVVDMNGDQLPDSVVPNGIRYNNGQDFDATVTTAGKLPYGKLRHVRHNTRTDTLGAANTTQVATSADGKSTGYVSYGLGVGNTYGMSSTDVDTLDINGDGLPDQIKEVVNSDGSIAVTVRLNLGYSFTEEMPWPSSVWAESMVGDTVYYPQLLSQYGDKVSANQLRVEMSRGDTVNTSGGGGGGGPSGGGGGYKGSATSTGNVQTLVDLIDINGDGLVDQVFKQPSSPTLYYKLNLGNGFAPEASTPIPDWPGSGDESGAVSGQSQASSGQSIGGSADIYSLHLQADYASSNGTNLTTVTMEDIDGDGHVDQVFRRGGQSMVMARLNTSGKANLLNEIDRPMGGKISIEYARQGNYVDRTQSPMVDMPKSQWVLSKVTVVDGQGSSYISAFDYSVPKTPGSTTRVGSGFYDRLERQELGYRRVQTTRGVLGPSGFVGGDGSQVERFYKNQSFYTEGLLEAEYEKDGVGNILRGVRISYNPVPTPPPPARTGSAFPWESSRETGYFEGSTTDISGVAPKRHIETKVFDNTNGDLTSYGDQGDEQTTADDVNYSIGYYRESATYITRPSSIQAFSSSGQIQRRREATYNPGTGTLQTLTNYIYGGKDPASGAAYNGRASTHSYVYDQYGNVVTHTDPVGYTLKYTYDTTAATYRTKVDDLPFGYSSQATPNLSYGTNDNTTDINGQVESYLYDNYGRLVEVRSPNDQGATPTIAMTYVPDAMPAYAMTKLKDIQHLGDTIDTVTFVDGLGRVIQTKKDMECDADSCGTTTPATGMSVSGLVQFDSRGRVASQGQPIFDKQAQAVFVDVNDTNSTKYTYDSIGRTVKVVGPDGATTTMEYLISTDDPLPSGLAVSGTWLATRVTDPMGNATGATAHTGQKVTYDDARGRHVAVKEYNQVGTSSSLTPLITQYQYDPMGDLLKVIDAKLKETTSEYDTLGQMVTLTSPDAGKTEYRYDAGGNLGWKQTAVLAAQSKFIKYAYEASSNRLKTITYPLMSPVTYTYGTKDEKGGTGNLAGRVKQVTMEGGSELRYYDKMGNVNKTVTTLKHLQQPSIADQVFTMQFSYDSFGRMQTMTFPNWIQNDWKNVAGNGELVSYFYDRGGNIDKITGYQQTQNPQHPEYPRNFAYLNHMGYDEFEQRKVMTSGNGIVNKYGYDPLTRRLLAIDASSLGAQEKQLGKPATPFHAMHYYYDMVGNITKVENATTVYTWQNASVRTGPMTMSYTYDNLYQLRSTTGKYRPDRGYGYDYTSTFQYDETANLVKKSQLENRLVWDNQNPPAGLAALTGSRFDHTVSSYSYTLDYTYAGTRPHAASKIKETSSTGSANDHVVNYDANGNNAGNVYMGATRTMTWDEENRLKEVKDATVSRGKFLYAPDGERTQKQTTAGDTFYLNQFFVVKPSGILPTKHIFAGETRIVSKTDPISQVAMISYYHPDHLGSTSYTSAGDQTLLQHERYFPFGERDTGDQEECDLGRPDNMRRDWLFTSKELDFDTGLYYFGARYYDPKTSVWQSPDPILGAYMQGKPNKGVFAPRNLGLYSYTWNNPVRFIDPNGMVCAETGASGPCGGGSGTLDPGLVDLPTFEREPVPILASMTPIAGPVLDFRADVESGHFGWAALNAVFAILDAFTIGVTAPERGLAVAEARGLAKNVIRQEISGRSGALNEAKADLRIPRSQQPDVVNRAKLTNKDGSSVLGPDGKPIMTREYTYSRQDGSKAVIQDHSAGHKFGEGGVGDQGPHFNVRPPENTRTGTIPGTREHYKFGKQR